MSTDEQIRLIDEKSVYLCSIQEAEGEFSLFQLHGFYVEVFYSRCYEEETLIICFDDPGLLEPYFSFIDINEVYAVLALH